MIVDIFVPLSFLQYREGIQRDLVKIKNFYSILKCDAFISYKVLPGALDLSKPSFQTPMLVAPKQTQCQLYKLTASAPASAPASASCTTCDGGSADLRSWWLGSQDF